MCLHGQLAVPSLKHVPVPTLARRELGLHGQLAVPSLKQALARAHAVDEVRLHGQLAVPSLKPDDSIPGPGSGRVCTANWPCPH